MNKHQGIVLFYLPEKGYGYLRLEGTQEEFYFRKTNLLIQVVEKGDRVSFQLAQGRQGYFADNIELAGIA